MVSDLTECHIEKRQKKERKIKDKELKKLRQLNGGDEGSGEGGTARTSAPGSDEDEELKSSEASSSSSSSSSDSSPEKGGTPTPSGQKKINRKASLRENDDGDVSSVSTRRSKTERNHYILRTAIDEKYVPRSI